MTIASIVIEKYFGSLNRNMLYMLYNLSKYIVPFNRKVLRINNFSSSRESYKFNCALETRWRQTRSLK